VNEVTYRKVDPDDELYSEQWGIPLIGADRAWEELKGDTTAFGDDIVVAVLDDGLFIDHPDLTNQIWTNPHEIPNNGIDDDENGFVDDINGWNFKNESPIHASRTHGTAVAGILGATTNNGEGISGVAYNTKMIPLTPSKRTTEIYSALEYAIQLRKKYNETNGREGSFVVAANLSFGIESAFPAELPTWCDLFDSMSHVGIIPVVSTTNRNQDIEIIGDVPGLCGTETQITVTKTTREDEKDQNEGGFSRNFVHLGAPGQQIQSTNSDGTYRQFDGTSASAPFVSGVIALLYSAPCPELSERALTQPKETALKVKNLILNSSIPIESLAGITISEGRLDVAEALKMAPIELCARDSSFVQETGDRVKINSIYPNPNQGQVRIKFTPQSLDPVDLIVFDMLGKPLFEKSLTIDIFDQQDLTFEIPNSLFAGTYILQLSQNDSKDQSLIIYSP
jgi:subtilisin family serine protease